MPSPGSDVRRRRPLVGPRPDGATVRAGDLLLEGRARERSGCPHEAEEYYDAAVAAGERCGDRRVVAGALRRLGVLRYQHGEPAKARELCQRSFDVATAAADELLAAEALNTLATLDLQTGELDAARERYARALQLGGQSLEVRARVEQNLGIIANIRGDFDEALTHYRASLDAYEGAGDQHGRAIGLHNLGMISADRELWDQADGYFQQSLVIAEASGDLHLQGLCRLNCAEVHFARQQYQEALRAVEAALVIFDQIDARGAKAEAYRVIGMVYREIGRTALAESRLRAAIDLAKASDSKLAEAEGTRELALLYRGMGRNQDALMCLTGAYRLFRLLDARIDLGYVGGKVAELESTYLHLVREWGQSIESADSYTFGHCERVASYAVAVARALGLDEEEQTAIRLGAYLHDVGKVRVPHEVLNKPGPLTAEEREVVQMHPVWGIELVAAIEFPWDLKPIIRWHHEKFDGTGYPDRLQGDEIPVAAQIVGIADVFDALTTTRSYRGPMTRERALRIIREGRSAWSAAVHQAFQRAVQEEAVAA